MKCKECNQLLVSYLDNEVSPKEREAIQAHLAVCSSCSAELEALANTLGEFRQGLDQVAAGASASPDAWSNIKQRIAEEDHAKAPLLDLRGLWKDLKNMKLRSAATWERAAVSVMLVGALVAGLLAFLAVPGPVDRTLGPLQVSDDLGDSQLVPFASHEELEEFVGTESQYPYYWYDGATGDVFFALAEGDSGSLSNLPDYSETNIQVEGVDEADIVKTDGKYIYAISEDRIVIVDVYPAEGAALLSEIELEGNLEGIYLYEDRLVVFEVETPDYQDYSGEGWYYSAWRTSIKIYDVSQPESPDLEREVAVDGSYWNSRMLGGYVYVVVGQPAYCLDDEVEIPSIYLSNTVLETPAEEILHHDGEEWGSNFTTVIALDVTETNQEAEYLGHGMFLLGNTSNMYVSQSNIYITCDEYDSSAEYSETTTIHRIHFESGKMEYDATGEVPGRVLNQFSMDEYQNYFRIATTTGNTWDASSGNHLYVLDDDLNVVGALEDLAPGEEIFSARFMGDRCYLVTFVKVDPLFVIDLSDPYSPEVLGELKITGYSDYLHPYDENHVIGIGKETAAGFYQGVKISLFDVSDVSNPKEIGKYEIGDRGTDSPVLDDHKALLFDRSRNLLVVPVLVYKQGNYYTWQGAYVFDISVDGGLELRDGITHFDSDADLSQIYPSSPLAVERSLYIGDVLYTLSEAKIMMNDLENLEYINEVALG
jgi:inhibitor of cysteine peptidase